MKDEMRAKIPIIIAFAGAAIGYFVLSPFAMYISHITHLATPVHEMTLEEVFTSNFLLWTLSFTLFGAAIGLVIGLLYQRVRERTEGVKKSKNYLDLVLDSMDEGMLTIDRDYKIVRANRSFLETSGQSLDEVIGKPCHEVSHGVKRPCNTSEHLCPFKEVLETGAPSTTVHTHFDKDGNEIYVELNASPVKDEEGNIVQIIELTRDITKRRRIHEALRETEERLRSIVESTEDIIVMQDLEGKYLYYNAPARYKVASEDVVGKTPWDIHKPEAAAKIMERVKKVGVTGDSLTDEEESTMDGATHYFNVQVSPIKDAAGNVVAVTTILRNITESKWAEMGLKKYIEDLEEASQMKDIFTDIMTHDLTSPAMAIMNAAELLLDEAEGEDRVILETIAWGVKRQIEIIDLTSKLSKLKSTEQMDKQPLDLKEVIENVVETTRSLFEEAGMEVENKITEPVPVNANPVIEEVFLNLLTNTVRYAIEGKKAVIEAKDEGISYTVSVKDFGPGIPEKNKRDIFERFTRRAKESVKGTGLGLTIAKRVVDMHEGKIWVEDNPSGGAVFKVNLPK